LFALGIFVLSLLLAYLMGGFSNFFLRRPFVSDAVLCVVLMVTVGFVVISFFNKEVKPQAFATGVDWRLIPAAILILFALWILAAIALACSTRLDIIPTLAICSCLFLLGIMSDYLFGRRADPVWRYDLKTELSSARWSVPQKALLTQVITKYDADTNGMLEFNEREKISPEDKTRLSQAGMGGTWWASVLYTVTPNWQLFWLADMLDADLADKNGTPIKQPPFHWSYVVKAFGYVLGYVGAALAVAVVLFEERELS
jgi:hypothetical protein